MEDTEGGVGVRYIYLYIEREKDIHTHIHTYIHISIHRYIHTYTHTYIYARTHFNGRNGERGWGEVRAGSLLVTWLSLEGTLML